MELSLRCRQLQEFLRLFKKRKTFKASFLDELDQDNQESLTDDEIVVKEQEQRLEKEKDENQEKYVDLIN